MGTGPIKRPIPNKYDAITLNVLLLLGICNPQRKSIGICNPKFDLLHSPHRTEEEDPSVYPPHKACREDTSYIPLPAPAGRG